MWVRKQEENLVHFEQTAVKIRSDILKPACGTWVKPDAIKTLKCLNNFNERILWWLFSLYCKLEQSDASVAIKISTY